MKMTFAIFLLMTSAVSMAECLDPMGNVLPAYINGVKQVCPTPWVAEGRSDDQAFQQEQPRTKPVVSQMAQGTRITYSDDSKYEVYAIKTAAGTRHCVLVKATGKNDCTFERKITCITPMGEAIPLKKGEICPNPGGYRPDGWN